MSTAISIRKFDPKRDAAAFRALNFVTFRDSIPPTEPLDLAAFERHYQWLMDTLAPTDTRRNQVFVAEIGGAYAGHLWLGVQSDFFTRRPDPWIFDLSVAPDFRKRGVARALHDHVVAWLRARGSTLVGLQVMAHNPEAAKLYEQLGYKPRAISLKLEL